MSTPVPLDTKREFLSALSETGNILETCRRTGVNRATAYHWRGEPDFNQMWEEALQINRESIRDELVTKAMAATGHVVHEPLLDADGTPVLDDNFEPVIHTRLVDYDGQVLRTMLTKFVPSADGAPVTAVQVNNHIHAERPKAPKLVQPEMDSALDLEFEEMIDVDA